MVMSYIFLENGTVRIQRNHQKLVEESPSAALSEALREADGEGCGDSGQSLPGMKMQERLSFCWSRMENFILWK